MSLGVTGVSNAGDFNRSGRFPLLKDLRFSGTGEILDVRGLRGATGEGLVLSAAAGNIVLGDPDGEVACQGGGLTFSGGGGMISNLGSVSSAAGGVLEFRGGPVQVQQPGLAGVVLQGGDLSLEGNDLTNVQWLQSTAGIAIQAAGDVALRPGAQASNDCIRFHGFDETAGVAFERSTAQAAALGAPVLSVEQGASALEFYPWGGTSATDGNISLRAPSGQRYPILKWLSVADQFFQVGSKIALYSQGVEKLEMTQSSVVSTQNIDMTNHRVTGVAMSTFSGSPVAFSWLKDSFLYFRVRPNTEMGPYGVVDTQEDGAVVQSADGAIALSFGSLQVAENTLVLLSVSATVALLPGSSTGTATIGVVNESLAFIMTAREQLYALAGSPVDVRTTFSRTEVVTLAANVPYYFYWNVSTPARLEAGSVSARKIKPA